MRVTLLAIALLGASAKRTQRHVKLAEKPATKLTSAMSLEAEVRAAKKRLEDALDSGDVSLMTAALNSAGPTVMLPGIEPHDSAAIQALAAQVATRMSDEEVVNTGRLRRNKVIRACIARLWDLMVAESMRIRRAAGEEPTVEEGASQASSVPQVSREGYRQVHMRMSKVLAPKDAFDNSSAVALADQDWAEDIAKYSGSSHIMVWLDEIREKFKESSTRAVVSHGFTALFAKYDKQVTVSA